MLQHDDTITVRRTSPHDYIQLLNLRDLSQLSCFGTRAWHQLMESSFDVTVEYLGVFFGSEMVWCLPVVVKRIGWVKVAGAPLRGCHTDRCDVVFAPDLTRATSMSLGIGGLVVSFIKRNYAWFECGEDVAEELCLDTVECNQFNRLTSLVQVNQNDDSMLAGFEGRARTAIRKAIKKGCVAGRSDGGAAWIFSFYTSLEYTFRRNGRKPPHPKKFYQRLIENENSEIRENLVLLDVYSEGQVVSRGIFLKDQERFVFLSGTTSEKGFKVEASSFLLFEAMKIARSRGCECFDLGGMGNRSIDKFKNSFKGRKVSRNYFIFSSGLWLHLGLLAIKIKNWLRE